MKLVHCFNCGDIFNLRMDTKTCSCGTVSGRYIDDAHAEVTGKHLAIAIGNGSFHKAQYSVLMAQDAESDWRYDARRDDILSMYENMAARVPGIMLCWARSSSGPANSHTSSYKDKE